MRNELTLRFAAETAGSPDDLKRVEAVLERYLPGLDPVIDQYGGDPDEAKRDGSRMLLVETRPPKIRRGLTRRFSLAKEYETAIFGTFGAGFTPAYPLDTAPENVVSWLATVSFNRRERWIEIAVTVRCAIEMVTSDPAAADDFAFTLQGLAEIVEPNFAYVSDSTITGLAPLQVLNNFQQADGELGVFGYAWMTVVRPQHVEKLRLDPEACSAMELSGASTGGRLLVACSPPAVASTDQNEQLRAVSNRSLSRPNTANGETASCGTPSSRWEYSHATGPDRKPKAGERRPSGCAAAPHTPFRGPLIL